MTLARGGGLQRAPERNGLGVHNSHGLIHDSPFMVMDFLRIIPAVVQRAILWDSCQTDQEGQLPFRRVGGGPPESPRPSGERLSVSDPGKPASFFTGSQALVAGSGTHN